MKKFNLLLILLIIMLCNNSVFAKDTVISMNKYKEESTFRVKCIIQIWVIIMWRNREKQ